MSQGSFLGELHSDAPLRVSSAQGGAGLAAASQGSASLSAGAPLGLAPGSAFLGTAHSLSGHAPSQGSGTHFGVAQGGAGIGPPPIGPAQGGIDLGMPSGGGLLGYTAGPAFGASLGALHGGGPCVAPAPGYGDPGASFGPGLDSGASLGPASGLAGHGALPGGTAPPTSMFGLDSVGVPFAGGALPGFASALSFGAPHGGGTSHAAPVAAMLPNIDDLAFVNRGAEVLDVLVPNLLNQQRRSSHLKMSTPIAAQPPGTGKTILGYNICNVLRRPREASEDEEIVARRLAAAATWSEIVCDMSNCLRDARSDAGRDNLLMRVLLRRFPQQELLLRALQKGVPLVVRMEDVRSTEASLDAALGVALFAAHTGDSSASGLAVFIRNNDLVSSSAVDIASAIVKLSGGCLMLVLDDINALGNEAYAKWCGARADDPPAIRLHRAMRALSPCLGRLHRTQGCLVFAIGRSLSLARQGLAGVDSPLFQSPVILQPLASHDVLDILRHTTCATGRMLSEEVGVVPALRDYLAHQCASVTGGVGRVLHALLWGLKRRSRDADASSKEDVLAAIEAVRKVIFSTQSFVLRLKIDWDQPALDFDGANAELQKLAVEKEVLHTLVRAILINASCAAEATIRAGTSTISVADAAVILGLSYSPHLIGADPDDDDPLSPEIITGARKLIPSPGRIVITAGDWLCDALRTDPQVISDPALSASASLLSAMRSFAGTMRGRPFELLCVEALCARSALSPGCALQDMLPHMANSMVARSVVPALRVVFLPKVKHAAKALTESDKVSILRLRARWTGPGQITLIDLEWALTVWLESGIIALPRDYQSGSQDFVVRLENRFIGVANKADGPLPGTQWAKISDELQKAPALPAPHTYTLVLWSLHLGEDVTKAMAGRASLVLGSGSWYIDAGGRALTQRKGSGAAAKAAVFVVGDRAELVLVNPQSAGPGIPDGLCELLGPHTRAQLDSLPATGDCDIAAVEGWAPPASAPEPPMRANKNRKR